MAIHCSFCEEAVWGMLNDMVPTCKTCASLVGVVDSGQMLTQCSKCAKLLNGALRGRVVKDFAGTPYTHLALSHGLCRECADDIRAAWLAQKAKLMIAEHGNIIGHLANVDEETTIAV